MSGIFINGLGIKKHKFFIFPLGTNQQDAAIHQMDKTVLSLGEFIKAPKSKIVTYTLKFIGKFEEKNVGRVISRLREG